MAVTDIIIWVCLAVVAVCIVAMFVERHIHKTWTPTYKLIFVVVVICFFVIGIMHLMNGQ